MIDTGLYLIERASTKYAINITVSDDIKITGGNRAGKIDSSW